MFRCALLVRSAPSSCCPPAATTSRKPYSIQQPTSLTLNTSRSNQPCHPPPKNLFDQNFTKVFTHDLSCHASFSLGCVGGVGGGGGGGGGGEHFSVSTCSCIRYASHLDQVWHLTRSSWWRLSVARKTFRAWLR